MTTSTSGVERFQQAEADGDSESQLRRRSPAARAASGHEAGARSPVLFNMVASLNWIQDGTAVGIDYPAKTRNAILSAHRRIYLAIEVGDPEMAEAAIRIHVGEFADHAERYYAHVLDAPLRWDQVDT